MISGQRGLVQLVICGVNHSIRGSMVFCFKPKLPTFSKCAGQLVRRVFEVSCILYVFYDTLLVSV